MAPPKMKAPQADLATFRDRRFAHLRLKEALDDLELLLDHDLDSDLEGEELVVPIVGPTGVGKSTLLRRLESKVLQQHAEAMESDKNLIPVIYMKLAAPSDGNFNWKDHFHRMLECFSDVLIRKKVITHPQATLDGEQITNIRSLVRDEMRRATRNEFKLRGTRLLLLDEAGHLLLTRAGISARTQFELVKSIAIELGIPIVLAGDYSLAAILETNGQLTRRCEYIHLPRYQLGDLQTMNAYGESFRAFVNTILQASPASAEPGLNQHLDYFYMRSIGNPGLLHRWVYRGARWAIKRGDGVLTKKALEATAWPNKALKQFLKEAQMGEAILKDLDDSSIARDLGFEITPSLVTNTSTSNVGTKSSKATKKSGGRIGVRGPSKDPAGGIPRAS